MKENIVSELRKLDYTGIAAEYIFHNIADKAIGKLNSIINEIKNDSNENEKPILISSEDEILKQVLHNIKITRNWCNNISFHDLQNSKKLSDIFIELDFFLSPRRLHYDLGTESRIPLKSILNFDVTSYIILGGPGAGKTTLMKYICKQILLKNDFFNKKFSCPYVIRLREVESIFHDKYHLPESLYFILIEQLGISINFNVPKNYNKKSKLEYKAQFDRYYSIIKRIVATFLDEMNVLLILDGFDELLDSKLKINIVHELRELSMSLDNSHFILTSRTGEFNYDIEKSKTYEICSLTNDQVENFITKWIKDEERSTILYNQIQNSPFSDAVIRPLNIAHLCAIFERYGKIPERPKSVYRKIIFLLLEEWDSQRSINRVSRYTTFSSDRKFEFLSKIAFVLTSKLNKTVFTKNDLKLAYEKVNLDFELPSNEVNGVVDELESHSGLFLQSGFNKYEFSHKSIQEYLTAEYIAKSSILNFEKSAIKELPNEIAIAIALSSDPNYSFASLVLTVLRMKILDSSFWDPFIKRLEIEKPDFTRDGSLACALVYIYTKLLKKKLKFNDEITDHDLGDIKKKYYQSEIILSSKKFNQILNFISFHKNVKNSFSGLLEYYSQDANITNHLIRNKITSCNYDENKYYVLKRKKKIEGIVKTPKELMLNEYMIAVVNRLN